MDIDYAKYLINHADGFEEGGFGLIVVYDKYATCRFTDIENWYLYPFFLWKAIMGVDIRVSISSGYIEMGDPDDPFYGKRVSEFDSLDHAIEQALKYIYEQEKKNGD